MPAGEAGRLRANCCSVSFRNNSTSCTRGPGWPQPLPCRAEITKPGAGCIHGRSPLGSSRSAVVIPVSDLIAAAFTNDNDLINTEIPPGLNRNTSCSGVGCGTGCWR